MIVNRIARMKMVSGVFQAAPVVVSSLLYHHTRPSPLWFSIGNGRRISGAAALLVKTNRQDSASTSAAQQQQQRDDIDPQDLQYVSQIKTVTSSSSTASSTSYGIPKFHLISYLWNGYLSITSFDLGFGASQEKQRHALQWGLHTLVFFFFFWARIRRQPTSFLIF